MAQQRFTK
jgi:hypothetical protein